ncbi:MAG TPA: radical SAM protein [Oligoflexia bacterium]|nr:radical SAM protein [Oligoflexia bacterium]HMR25206.1 radical SAM protein [Oligoflexia bacterium]
MVSRAFENTYLTAKGEPRAKVELSALQTLWLNTGTLCNLSCEHCYIESSPRNDRLAYLSAQDVEPFLDEIKTRQLGTQMIGITDGEPFINPSIIEILNLCLSRGFETLVLSNAFKVLNKHEQSLLDLNQHYPEQFFIRVSLDHYSKDKHEEERGEGTFEKTMQRLQWLHANDFQLSVAGRAMLGENLADSQAGYKSLLEYYAIDLDLEQKLIIFPEMANDKDVPEISTACWDILGVKPEQQMCAHERMLVKHKGATKPVLMPCTLLAYDEQFVMGNTLQEADKPVYLNHRFCAQFCVLGGSSCSGVK